MKQGQRKVSGRTEEGVSPEGTREDEHRLRICPFADGYALKEVAAVAVRLETEIRLQNKAQLYITAMIGALFLAVAVLTYSQGNPAEGLLVAAFATAFLLTSGIWIWRDFRQDR